MVTPELITATMIFDRLLSAIHLISGNQREKTPRTDQSLYALYAALNETKSYVSYLDSGKKRDTKREFAIAKLWDDASVPLRKVDIDLARRCFDKASYWRKPDAWTQLMINEKQIALDQVIESTRDLLMNSPY